MVEVFNRAGYNNLRHLHRAFLDFERFFNSLSGTHKNLPGLLDDLLPVFLSFSFEIQAGRIRPTEIEGLIHKVIEAAISKKEHPETHKSSIVQFAEKHNLSDTYKLILPEQCWKSFFDKGFIPEGELFESIEKTVYAQSDKTPAWVKLWHYAYLKDDEFSCLLREVTRQWEKRAFQLPEEIMHVSGLFLRFSELGLVPKSTAETVKDCKDAILRLEKLRQ